MGKAVISNRIYLDVDEELKAKLIAALTYRIERKSSIPNHKFKQYDVIKVYKVISPAIMSIPSGRADLIPADYTIIDKRIVHDMPFPNPLIPAREDQNEVIDNVTSSCLINALPGWGKTFCALHLARKLGQKTLVVTHTTALRDQWVEEVQKLYNMPVGIVGSGIYDIDHAIVVGNVQSLTKYKAELSKEFGTIIVDECHHISATTFSDLVDISHAKYKIGLSGTIVRTDGKHVMFNNYFSAELFQPALANTMAPTIRLLKSNRMLLPGVAWVNKVNDLLYDPNYQSFVAALALVKMEHGHKVLITADRVEFLEKVGDLIGEDCLCITSKVKDFDDRKALIDKLYTGEKSCIAGSRQIFSEGISVPPLSCLIIASPTANEITLEQTIGRIMRLYPDKLPPEVLDISFLGPEGRKQLKLRQAFYARKGWRVIEASEKL